MRLLHHLPLSGVHRVRFLTEFPQQQEMGMSATDENQFARHTMEAMS